MRKHVYAGTRRWAVAPAQEQISAKYIGSGESAAPENVSPFLPGDLDGVPALESQAVLEGPCLGHCDDPLQVKFYALLAVSNHEVIVIEVDCKKLQLSE